MKTKKNSNLMLYLIPIYMILTNLLQILCISDKGSFLDILVKFIILAGLILTTFFYSVRNNIKIEKKNLMFFVVFLFSILMVFLFNTDFYNLNMSEIVSTVYPLINIFIFITLLGNQSINPSDFKKILKFFSIYVLYMCVFNFIVNFNDIINFSIFNSAYSYNFSSFFNNRNTFSFYLMFGIITTYILINNYKEKNKLFLFSLIFMIINIMLAMSRTGMICTAIFFFLNFIFNTTSKNKIISIIILFIGLAVLLSNENFSAFIVNFIIRKDSGLTGRNNIWEFGFNLAKNNLFLGLGFYKPIFLLEQSVYNIASYHNTFLSIFLYGGIVLTFTYIFCYIKILIDIFKLKKYDKKIHYIFLSIFFVYIVYGFAETQVLFFPSAVNFVSTSFVCLIPKYLLNYYSQNSTDSVKKEDDRCL